MGDQASSPDNERPWYQDGLRFECTQCGDCCTGGPGYVWVNKAEIEAIAATLGIEEQQFREEYLIKVGVRYSLRELKNYDCILLDGKTRKCTVYNVRPRQCRTWPFWESNLKTPADWERTCQECPGSGQGQLVQIEEIETRRKLFRV